VDARAQDGVGFAAFGRVAVFGGEFRLHCRWLAAFRQNSG
jgi:hypothetical protein